MNLLKRFLCLSLIVPVLVSQGCATLLTGTSSNIFFYTTPEGADVYINNIKEGITPVEIKVKKKTKERIVVIKKEGYKEITFVLDKSFNALYLLNIIGLFGFGIDVLTGATIKYDKNYYDIELELKEAN